jgi:hypothetical protein
MARRSEPAGRDGDRIDAAFSRLYKLPPHEFVAARDALVARLKKDGDDEAARRARALQKPLASAWVVNRLYWSSRRTFARLLAAGEDLRTLQHASLGGRATERRRKASGALVSRAEAILVETGRTASRDLMRRIEQTLEAIAIHGNAGGDQTLGRMTRDLEPPGFEALLALAADAASTGAARGADPAPRSKKKKKKPDRRLERARQALTKAEREAGRRRAEAEKAAGANDRATERAQRAREREARAKKALEEAFLQVREADADLARARERADRTAAALAGAEKTARKARETARKARSIKS